jgi:hypothetical protein
MLLIANGTSVLTYLRRSEWAVFFVYSPIELVPAALAAAGVGLALLQGRIRSALAGGILLGGVLVVASAVTLLVFFGFEAADSLVPLLGGILFVASGALLVRSSPPRANGSRRDWLALSLGIAGAVLILVSVFVEYEIGASLASVGTSYWLEPIVAVGSIAAALLLLTVLARPVIAAGLLIAVGVQTALHDVGVIVAASIGGSSIRAAGFIGLVGGALAASAGARVYRLSTSAMHS